MSPDDLRDCLAALCWSQRGFAAIVDVDEGQVRRWARGDATVPPRIAAWLVTLAEFHRKHPLPAR